MLSYTRTSEWMESNHLLRGPKPRSLPMSYTPLDMRPASPMHYVADVPATDREVPRSSREMELNHQPTVYRTVALPIELSLPTPP